MFRRLRSRLDGLGDRILRGPGAAPAVVVNAVPAAAVRPPEVTLPSAPAVAPPPAPLPEPASAPVPAPARLHADTASTDMDAYRARARAAGRDLRELAGTSGRNVAADGVAYVGPLDNESSRASAAGLVLTVDPWECISCGTCVEHTDAVFALPPDGKATPLRQDGPMDLIQDAIDACPVTCIRWVPRDEALERGLHTGPLSARG
jgi:ferredoxin